MNRVKRSITNRCVAWSYVSAITFAVLSALSLSYLFAHFMFMVGDLGGAVFAAALGVWLAILAVVGHYLTDEHCRIERPMTGK